MALCYSALISITLLLLVGVPDAISITLPPPSNHLTVYALPVGQGDCTVIQCPNGNIVLMDCGSSSAGDNQMYHKDVENYLGNQINNVVAIMITHPDRDHFNYIPSINWNRQAIQAVIIGGKRNNYYRSNNDQFKAIYNFLVDADNSGKLYTLNNGQKCIGNCAPGNLGTNFCNNNNIKFQFLGANIRSSSNQKSIVMKIVVGRWSMLLSGDMEGAAATEIAKALAHNHGNYLQSTVYKMSHHGASSQANKKTWLNAIQPKAAFASSGYNHGNNRHPRCDAVKRLLDLGTIVHAPGHRFYCGNGKGKPPSLYNNFDRHIYETSPRDDEMCILVYCGSREVQFYSIPQTRIPRPLPGLRNGMRDAGCGMRDATCSAPHPASRIPHTF